MGPARSQGAVSKLTFKPPQDRAARKLARGVRPASPAAQTPPTQDYVPNHLWL